MNGQDVAAPAEPARCNECGRLVTAEQQARFHLDYSAATDARVLLDRHRAAAHQTLGGRP